MKIEGGCLCGRVRYHADTTPLRTVVCHCKNCQKQAGTAFSLVVVVSSDALKLEGETVDYIDIGDSGAEVRRRFCGACGSPLLSEIPSRPGMAFIKSGTLDDTSWLVPQAHIWRRSAQPWVYIDPDLPSFDGPFGSAPSSTEGGAQ
jgi:hypothetical protein